MRDNELPQPTTQPTAQADESEKHGGQHRDLDDPVDKDRRKSDPAKGNRNRLPTVPEQHDDADEEGVHQPKT
jgi:hypothetical protein